MGIQHISSDGLRRMPDQEGLVLMGCGGDPQEWVDGINGLLTDDGILRDGARFENISVFEHEGLTCLLFHFDNVKLDVGRLAMWRLRTHEHFGGTWLSDFVPNRLGGYLRKKPDCPLIGMDGSISDLAGVAARTLRENGMEHQAQEMAGRALASGSYGEALRVIGEYVNITDGKRSEQGRAAPRGRSGRPKER